MSDELLTETNHNVLRHMEGCKACREEIEARRAIRQMLKSAVIEAPEYRIDPAFASGLESRLKGAPVGDSAERPGFGFSGGPVVAIAAGLLLVFALGFVLLSQFGSPDLETVGETPSINDLQPNHIVNVALGDHEHCAIRHDLKESPIALTLASAKYKGLDKIVATPLNKAFADYKLVEAHACKYKETRFAHIVFKNESNTLSVLVTSREEGGKELPEVIEKFATNEYRVGRFNTKEHSIFVISDLDERRNTMATEALFKPLNKHFGGVGQIQTTLLMVK